MNISCQTKNNSLSVHFFIIVTCTSLWEGWALTQGSNILYTSLAFVKNSIWLQQLPYISLKSTLSYTATCLPKPVCKQTPVKDLLTFCMDLQWGNNDLRDTVTIALFSFQTSLTTSVVQWQQRSSVCQKVCCTFRIFVLMIRPFQWKTNNLMENMQWKWHP